MKAIINALAVCALLSTAANLMKYFQKIPIQTPRECLPVWRFLAHCVSIPRRNALRLADIRGAT